MKVDYDLLYSDDYIYMMLNSTSTFIRSYSFTGMDATGSGGKIDAANERAERGSRPFGKNGQRTMISVCRRHAPVSWNISRKSRLLCWSWRESREHSIPFLHCIS